MPTSPFAAVADRVRVAVSDPSDEGSAPANVTVVEGTAGALVVDPHPRTGHDLLGALRSAGARPRHVVLTHRGPSPVEVLTALSAEWPDLTVHVHESVALPDDAGSDGRAAPWSVEVLSSVAVLDLGDRPVELVHPGRGHGAGDVVVRVPDVDLLVTGPTVVADDPHPGPDCFPLEWPLSLDFVLQLLTDSSIVVPGRGPLVDRDHVEDQRAALGVVAETVRDLAGRGVTEADALARADWPLPVDHLDHAVRRAYEQLPRAQRRLPLV